MVTNFLILVNRLILLLVVMSLLMRRIQIMIMMLLHLILPVTQSLRKMVVVTMKTRNDLVNNHLLKKINVKKKVMIKLKQVMLILHIMKKIITK